MALNKNNEINQVIKDTSQPKYQEDTLPLVKETQTTNQNVNSSNTIINQGLTAITQEGDVLFKYSENIVIQKNSDVVIIPEKTQGFKYKLNSYLLEYPDTELVIESKYSAEENIETPNYGALRAQKIKSLLLQAGVSPERIVIKPHITPIDFKGDGTFNNAFSFTIQPLNLERVIALENEVPESMTIYPNFSGSGILISPTLEKAMQEVKTALENNPNLKITVVGHTDNVGNALDNHKIGLDFARQMRWYLIAKGGIAKEKVVAISEGESQAIASNNTEKGRRLNQRIELKFSLD
ncbi:OmpA family protein [Marinirhabdus gelatinilytica]|uniref:OmpA family protein n=1 Tax=Marinirhabdus gelatinilytica TaxID=1703343 RepID=A0A370QA78_9FLAO|nr:OmpA family protein [Marinirhabdus gelatinilytica]RDK85278.1 OmpA family protein [Marinirhabdus gelatinilytica]